MHLYSFNGVVQVPTLIALDSGTRSPGIAAFSSSGELLEADNIDVTEWAGQPEAQRWLNVGRALVGWVRARCHNYTEQLSIVFERPQWYARSKSKGDPNQLAGLTGVAGVFIGQLAALYPVFVGSYTPAEWIGQLSKVCPVCDGTKGKGRGKKRVLCSACNGSDWETPRGRYIRKRLSPAEQNRCPDQNDAIDAVGVGLKELGRLEPIRVLSNGRDGR